MLSSGASKRTIIIVVGVLFVVVLAVVYAVLSRKPGSSISLPQDTVSPSPDVENVLSYNPPEGAQYTALGDVNFIPRKINDITIDREQLIRAVQSTNRSLSEAELVRTLNAGLFTYLAMNEFNQRKGQQGTSMYQKKNIDNYLTLERELRDISIAYNQDAISMEGFYLKVQFANVLKDNIVKLGKREDELRPLARSIIAKYRSAALGFRDKSRIVTFINEDEQAALLNNGGKSEIFKNYTLSIPLLPDPSFYDIVQSLQPGAFSDILTFKQFVAGKKDPQDAIYVVFYIDKKNGTNLPLSVLRDKYIAAARLQ